MKNTLKTTIITIVAIFVVAGTVQAVGTLTPSGTAGDDTQYSLNDIYAKITADTDATLGSGTMTVPDASTATSTFRTLTEIYNALPDWQTLSNATTTVSEGFYEATDLATVDSDLTSGNIASGVNIFGVSGSISGDIGLPKTNVALSEPTYTSDRICADGGTGKCDDFYYERGLPTSGNRFVDNSDGTISDAVTGLMWFKCRAGITGSDCSSGSFESNTLQNAINFCEDSDLGGHTDWRLPNVLNAITLMDFGSNPHSYSTYFSSMESTLTSTPFPSDPTNKNYKVTYGINFALSGQSINTSSGGIYFCVRDNN